jgi:glycosyltransferase 2 family protein
LKKIIYKWLSILLPVFLGIFLTIYSYNQFTEAQIIEIKSYFKNANYTIVMLAIFLAFIGNAVRAYRWKFMIEHLGYHSSFANNFMAVNIGYLLNLAIPKSGEISRALTLKKYNNIPFDKSFGTIVAERIIDLVVLVFMMFLAVVLQFNVVKTFILDKIPVKTLLSFSSIGLLLFILFILIYKYSKLKIIILFKQKISGLKEGVLSIFHMKTKWEYFFYTFVIWGSYLVMFYVAIFVIPETSHLSFGAVITAFVVGSIAVAFTNSGFGSYPFLISKVLVFYVVNETAGNAFGWIIWTSQMFLVLFLGLISFLLLPIFNKAK